MTKTPARPLPCAALPQGVAASLRTQAQDAAATSAHAVLAVQFSATPYLLGITRVSTQALLVRESFTVAPTLLPLRHGRTAGFHDGFPERAGGDADPHRSSVLIIALAPLVLLLGDSIEHDAPGTDRRWQILDPVGQSGHARLVARRYAAALIRLIDPLLPA